MAAITGLGLMGPRTAVAVFADKAAATIIPTPLCRTIAITSVQRTIGSITITQRTIVPDPCSTTAAS